MSFSLNAGVVEDLVELKELGIDEDGLLLSAQEGKMLFKDGDLKALKAKGFSEKLIDQLRAHTKTLQKISSGPRLLVEAVGENDPISLKVLSGKPEAIFLMDGKVVDRLERGVLRIRTTPGWHEVGLKWKGGEFSREVRIHEEGSEVMHLFAEVEVDEESQKLADSFLKESHSREVEAFCGKDFSRPIKNRFGVVKGREFFRGVKAFPVKAVKVLDKTWVRIQFQGYLQRELEDSQLLMSPSVTVFFTLDLNEQGEIISKEIKHPWVYRQYTQIVSEIEELDRDFELIRKYNSKLSSHPLNLKIVASESSGKKTKAFHLSLPHSKSIYTLGLGEWSICPLSRPYQTLWERKGLDPKGTLDLSEKSRLLVVLHSNWLGDKSQILKIPEGVELETLTYENFKEKLGL